MENWKLSFLNDNTLCTAGEGGRVAYYDILNGKEIKYLSVE